MSTPVSYKNSRRFPIIDSQPNSIFLKSDTDMILEFLSVLLFSSTSSPLLQLHPYIRLLITADLLNCYDPLFSYMEMHPLVGHTDFPKVFSRQIMHVIYHEHSTRTVIHQCKALEKKRGNRQCFSRGQAALKVRELSV